MVKKTKLTNIWLMQTILRIQEIDSKFCSINYFHVLWVNKSKADQAAIKAVGLEPSILLLSEDEIGWD